MKNFFYLLFILLVCKISFAQNETNNWYFGNKAAINFDSGRTNILSDSAMDTPNGCTTISDKKGNLLFYSNGKTIWNKNHEILFNGDGLAGDITNTQSSIFIPNPEDENKYYLFYYRASPSSNPLVTSGTFYSQIELTNSNPLGEVTLKNIRFDVSPPTSEKMTAIHSKSGNEFWILFLTVEDDEKSIFKSYKISGSGVNRTPILSEIDFEIPNSGGMILSPNGKKLAVAGNSVDELLRYVYYFDFNNETGIVKFDKRIVTEPIFSNWPPQNLAFSQDSKFLYIGFRSGNYNGLMQYKLEDLGDFEDPRSYLHFEENLYIGNIQLASDGKIYVSLSYENSDSEFLGVVENPDKKGALSNYKHNFLKLSPGASKKGLPNFIQSYFESRILAEDKCLGEIVNFSATSYIQIKSINWDFGDGSIITSLNPSYQFNTIGTKIVKAEFILENNKIVNVFKKLNIFKLPILNSNQELVQCDDDFDGISNFNLFNIREKITNPALEEEFIFYESSNDAQNDSNRILNPENFQNKIPNQEIFVKAINSNGCISFSSFRVRANYIQVDPISNMYVCEDSDLVSGNAQGSFDLIRKRINVVSELNLARGTTLRFYNTYSDALTTTNELIGNIVSPTTTIWVRVENDTGCGGIQSFNAIVNPQPVINLQDSYTICYDPTLKPAVVLSADISNDRFEWKNSSGNIISTNQNFTLINTGHFSLTAYKTENGIECSYTKEFEVINPEKPIFTDILANTEDETNNTVTVNISGNSTYEFSLDNKNFFGNSTSYTFTKVIPGLKTIYVRDINNCETPIQAKVSVLGVQDFFTPNGDGKNDFWNIRGLDPAFYKSINIQIFDRFGRIVASITDFNNPGWDGKLDGKIQISNNYWYKVEIVDIDDNLIKKTGNFSLIRK